jgi:hypothetical protein
MKPFSFTLLPVCVNFFLLSGNTIGVERRLDFIHILTNLILSISQFQVRDSNPDTDILTEQDEKPEDCVLEVCQ